MNEPGGEGQPPTETPTSLETGEQLPNDQACYAASRACTNLSLRAGMEQKYERENLLDEAGAALSTLGNRLNKERSGITQEQQATLTKQAPVALATLVLAEDQLRETELAGVKWYENTLVLMAGEAKISDSKPAKELAKIILHREVDRLSHKLNETEENRSQFYIATLKPKAQVVIHPRTF